MRMNEFIFADSVYCSNNIIKFGVRKDVHNAIMQSSSSFSD